MIKELNYLIICDLPLALASYFPFGGVGLYVLVSNWHEDGLSGGIIVWGICLGVIVWGICLGVMFWGYMY